MIIAKCNDINEALFYLRETINRGLSRNALDDVIRANLYQTTGGAVNNFVERLPLV